MIFASMIAKFDLNLMTLISLFEKPTNNVKNGMKHRRQVAIPLVIHYKERNTPFLLILPYSASIVLHHMKH
jgi:hypothetical protein